MNDLITNLEETGTNSEENKVEDVIIVESTNTMSIQYYFNKIQSIINTIVEYIILVKTGLNSIFSYKISITIIMGLLGFLIYYGIQNILFNLPNKPTKACDMSGNPIIVNDSEVVNENNNFEIIMVYTLGWIGLIWIISITV